MSQPRQSIYRLDGVEIDASRLCVTRAGQELHLRQKTFQVLIYLLEQRERLVTKDELIQHIWPHTAVTDNALDQCLAEIRKVLGEDSRQPRFIKTVPRAGYRFIGSVQENHANAPANDQLADAHVVASPSPSAVQQTGGLPSRASHWPPRRSVLVFGALLAIVVTVIGATYLIRRRATSEPAVRMTLPQDPNKRPVAVMFFDNESGSAEIDWLREGLADMIITDLSRSTSLAVLSRQQLHVLLERIGHRESEKIRLDEAINIARQSQAKIIVLGSFAKLGEQIRIDVRLHDARDGQLLTAERLTVEEPGQILTQVDLISFKLATYIVGSTPDAAKTGLSSVMTNNLEAYRYYSLGVELAQALRSEEALSMLQKAVALDPNFAMAHARIGYVYGVTGNNPEKAKPYLEKAFQLTDRLTEKDKLNITAWYAIVNFDYAAAIEAFRRIVTADPLEIEAYRRLGLLLKGEGKHEEAITVLKQGLVIDSGARDLYNALGAAYSDVGRHDEAIAMFQRYVQLAPDEPNSHDSLGLGYQWAGRYDEAIQQYQRALQLKPDFEIAVVHLGNVYFQQGRYRAAMEQFQRYFSVAPTDGERMRAYSSMAYVEFRRGNSEKAERTARTAYRYGKLSISNLYLLGLQRNDLATARKLGGEMERIQRLDRGLRGSPRPIWYFRGLLALKSGSHEEAISDFKQALGHRPLPWDQDAFEDCLANAYLELGRFDEAVHEYQRILKLNPNYPLVHYHLAQAYERKGQTDQARAEYEQFLQVWKDADADVPEVVAAQKALGS